jgi:hypothetical protein
MNIENDVLNDDWIQNFENTDNLYKDFYEDNNYYINIHVIYINKNNEIDKIKGETILMSKPNYLLSDELLKLLKKNSIEQNKRYSLMSILKINISLKPHEIKNFLLTKNMDSYSNTFIDIIKKIDNINFNKTINMFQDLNDLVLIFFENKSSNENKNNLTKKIYINHNSSHKKTLKKQYKNL